MLWQSQKWKRLWIPLPFSHSYCSTNNQFSISWKIASGDVGLYVHENHLSTPLRGKMILLHIHSSFQLLYLTPWQTHSNWNVIQDKTTQSNRGWASWKNQLPSCVLELSSSSSSTSSQCLICISLIIQNWTDKKVFISFQLHSGDVKETQLNWFY